MQGNLRFTDITVSALGRMHDARLFRESPPLYNGRRLTDNGRFHVFGDASSPLSDWLLTSYRNTGHLTRLQMRYNTAHASKRVTIKRALGVL